MLGKSEEISSPSRTYVALCINGNFRGYYFRKFTLPADAKNNAVFASWYFLNRLDAVACIEGTMPYEDYLNIKDA